MRITPLLRAEVELDDVTVFADHSLPTVWDGAFLTVLESIQDVMLYSMERMVGTTIPIANVTWTVSHLYLGSDLN